MGSRGGWFYAIRNSGGMVTKIPAIAERSTELKSLGTEATTAPPSHLLLNQLFHFNCSKSFFGAVSRLLVVKLRKSLLRILIIIFAPLTTQ